MMPSLRTTQMLSGLKRSTTLPSSKFSGRPTLTLLLGSARTLGMRKRRVPSVQMAMVPVKVAQAKANQLPNSAKRRPRRSSTLGLAGTGLAAAAGLGAAGVGVVAVGAAVPPGG